MNQKEIDEHVSRGLLIGWLDAIWSAFGDEVKVFAPVDIQQRLIGMGMLKPKEAHNGSGVRTVALTPLGIRTVIDANNAAGIYREIVDEDGTKLQ